ncbi:hypothetical protein QTO01_20570, partial [Vibrio mytili]
MIGVVVVGDAIAEHNVVQVGVVIVVTRGAIDQVDAVGFIRAARVTERDGELGQLAFWYGVAINTDRGHGG